MLTVVVVVAVVVVALRLPREASPRFTGYAAGRLQGYYVGGGTIRFDVNTPKERTACGSPFPFADL